MTVVQAFEDFEFSEKRPMLGPCWLSFKAGWEARDKSIEELVELVNARVTGSAQLLAMKKVSPELQVQQESVPSEDALSRKQ